MATNLSIVLVLFFDRHRDSSHKVSGSSWSSMIKIIKNQLVEPQ